MQENISLRQWRVLKNGRSLMNEKDIIEDTLQYKLGCLVMAFKELIDSVVVEPTKAFLNFLVNLLHD